MSRHKVEITGVNTANIKVLTNEEMLELFKKMKKLIWPMVILSQLI